MKQNSNKNTALSIAVPIEGLQGDLMTVVRTPTEEMNRLRQDMVRRITTADSQDHGNTQGKLRYRILFLGTNGSGKTTLIRQLQVMYGGGIDESERHALTNQIGIELIHAVEAVIEAMERYEMNFETAEAEDSARQFLQLRETLSSDIHGDLRECMSVDMRQQLTASIDILSKDNQFRAALRRGNEYGIISDIPYFLQHMSRVLVDDDYQPTDADIVHFYQPTVSPTTVLAPVTNIEDIV